MFKLLNHLYSQRGAPNYNPEIKSCSFFCLSQLAATNDGFIGTRVRIFWQVLLYTYFLFCVFSPASSQVAFSHISISHCNPSLG